MNRQQENALRQIVDAGFNGVDGRRGSVPHRGIVRRTLIPAGLVTTDGPGEFRSTDAGYAYFDARDWRIRRFCTIEASRDGGAIWTPVEITNGGSVQPVPAEDAHYRVSAPEGQGASEPAEIAANVAAYWRLADLVESSSWTRFRVRVWIGEPAGRDADAVWERGLPPVAAAIREFHQRGGLPKPSPRHARGDRVTRSGLDGVWVVSEVHQGTLAPGGVSYFVHPEDDPALTEWVSGRGLTPAPSVQTAAEVLGELRTAFAEWVADGASSNDIAQALDDFLTRRGHETVLYV